MFKNTVKIPTKINATAKLVNNKTATVSVKINDNNNKPVTGNTKVVVKLNGKTQANAIAVNLPYGPAPLTEKKTSAKIIQMPQRKII